MLLFYLCPTAVSRAGIELRGHALLMG